MRGNTCLLIESNQVQARAMMEMLAQAGWSVIAAFTLRDGLRFMMEQPVDVAITQLDLPDSRAADTVSTLRKANADLLVIAVTAAGPDAAAKLSAARRDGAVFSLSKPFTAERLKAVLDQAAELLSGAARQPHAIVVEESPTLRAICQTALAAVGYRVSVFETMGAMLEAIDPLDTDMLLTDITMQGRCALDGIALVREAMPGIGVVGMSGGATREGPDAPLRRALEAGAHVALPKPFSAADLVEAMRKACVMANADLLAAGHRAA